MWVDGIDISRDDILKKCFIIDNKYIFITDDAGHILFAFNIEFNGENINENIKIMAQKHILNYDIIKDMQ